jgi:antitoxin MazE6
MANIKTAISIDKPLFEQVNDLAHELKTSRSHIFVMAAKDYIQRHKNRKILEDINAAYDDSPDTKDESLTSVRRSHHLKMVKDQW